MKKQFFILSTFLIICFVLFSPLGVKEVKAYTEFPIDYTQVCLDNYVLYTTVWENIVAQGYNINPDLGILCDRNGSGANGSASLAFWYPAEPFNQNQSSISVSNRTDDYISVNTTNWYRWLVNADGSINSSSPIITNFASGGFIIEGVYTRPSSNTIIYNSYYSLPYANTNTFEWQSNSNVEIPIPDLHDFGSSSATGHGSGSPSDEINLNGFTWSHSTGSLQTSGHSSNVNSSSAVYDFSDPTQNLLGQLNDNTNTLIGHTSSIFSLLQQINNNLITGFSSTFNALSTINNNIITLTLYDQEKVDETWDNTSAKQFFDESVNFAGHLEESIGDYQDYYFSSAGPSTLEIPIDFRSWTFSTTDYGSFSPFNQIYYMRFPFLDETKALWQPFLLGLLYFALFYTLFTDLPNILRGAVR